MAVFTSEEFINKLKWLATEVPTVYYSGPDWSVWNGNSWNMDCVVSIKSILWGFCADYNQYRGGANYLSNGVADFTTWGGLVEHCSDISTDFHNLIPGEYLCMDNTSHAGIYLGDGLVYECTAAWENKCMITKIDEWGNRIYNGNYNPYKWTHHGKLEYIDYGSTPSPTPSPVDYTGIITYQAFSGEWQPEVNKCDETDEGFAGLYNVPMTGIKAKPQFGEITIQAHILNGEWLETVNSNDYYANNCNSYAGILGTPMDAIIIKSTKGYVEYQVCTIEDGWLPMVDSRTNEGSESYAGIFGHTIVGIRMK